MQVTIELPDEIASAEKAEMQRQVLESFVAEQYRLGKLSRNRLSQSLKLDYWQTEDFLTRHDARRPYTAADLEKDRESLSALKK